MKRRAPGFKEKRAAQVVAYFVHRSGGPINVLKLVKLLYLSDRESLRRYDFPILYDCLVSMDNWPVDSITLNYINGLEADSQLWDRYVTSREGHSVGISNPHLTPNDLDELSAADLQILDLIWQQHGHKDRFELARYTHENCPEWEDPHGSSYPIPYERVFKALGKTNSGELAEALAEDMGLLYVMG